MEKIKRCAVLVLVICLLTAMLPTVPLVRAEGSEATLTGIQIVIKPVKTEYFTGETLDTTGLTLMASYSDDSTAEITEGFTVTSFDSAVTGTQTLTVTYLGATATFPVTVKQPEMTGIEIINFPFKTEYWVGEILDTTGLTLLASYSNDSMQEISDGFSVTGFNSKIAGKQILTVTYMGATAAFPVTVKQPEMTGIEIVSFPLKTEYWVGEILDTAGLTLLATYSDDTTEEITEGFTVTGFNSQAAGVQTLTVTYMGATATFTVTVKQPEVIGIEVISQPAKTVYWTGEELDTAGLVLLATYLGGTTSQVTEGYTVTGFDSTLAGAQTLIVSYGDATAEFTVTVNKLEVTRIEVVSKPTKTEYWIGEELDTTGLVLEVAFSDGRILQTTEDYTVSGFNSAKAEQKTLSVYYQDHQEMFAVLYVEIKAPTTSTITGIEIYTLPAKTEYFVGEKKDFSGLSVYVLYSDGSKEVITGGWAEMGFKSTEAGIITITLRYRIKYTTTFTVTVKEPCTHDSVEKGICTQCNEIIAATVIGESGSLIGNYVDMADALEAAVSGSTVTLLSDTAIQDLSLPMGADLDLNGCALTVETVLTYGNSVITDSSPDNTGVLKITDPDGNMISPKNSCLPVYDSAKGGYRFFAIEVTACAVTGGNKYWFRIKAEKFAPLYDLICADAQVQIKVKMTWDEQENATYAAADLSFTKAWADRYHANEDIYITVSVADAGTLENFKLIPMITSGGVEISGEEM